MNILESPKESELFGPVAARFAINSYHPYSEVKFGRKHIDMLLVPNCGDQWIAVELKVRNWQKALWQAVINLEVAEQSYIALWHRSVPAALSQRALFERYGVGVICVSTNSVEIVHKATLMDNPTRLRQQLLVRMSLKFPTEGVPKFETISLLSA